MGKGLFGPNGGGLGGVLSALTGNSSGSGNNANGNSPLGGNIGQALGNLFKQPGRGGSRSIPAPGQSQSEPDASSQAPAATSQAPLPPQQSQAQNDQPQDSQAMNDVLRQLFNR